mmetsp:Transcript_31137/g.90488  ORF Transcript_31137/g.90488 Transcript_31137/m.90488 type:complete len:338 (+) Transcript_31137:650-1663(+)
MGMVHGPRLRRGLEQGMGAEVRGKDEDDVGEVYGAALTVRESAIVHNLEEHVEDPRVCLLDFVQQHDAVGSTAHGLGQRASLVVAHVARRGADEPGDGVGLEVLAHVDAHERPLVAVEEVRGQCLGQLRLANPGGAKEEEAPHGLPGAGQPRPRAQNAVHDGIHGTVLAHDPLSESGAEGQQALPLRLAQPLDGDPRPAGDDGLDVLRSDGVPGEPPPSPRPRCGLAGLLRGLEPLELSLGLGDCAIAKVCRPVIVPLSLRDRGLLAQGVELLFDPAEVLGLALLTLPALPQGRQLLPEVLGLATGLLEPHLGSLVLFLCQGGCLNLELEHATLHPV